MIKDFMKAFALAFMFLIGMMSFTGFGMTTPDLATNSETVCALEVAPVSVVIEAPAMVHINEAIEIGTSQNAINFKQVGHLSMAKEKATVQSNYDSGGGVLLFYANSEKRPNDQENYRSPRDGISCRLACVL